MTNQGRKLAVWRLPSGNRAELVVGQFPEHERDFPGGGSVRLPAILWERDPTRQDLAYYTQVLQAKVVAHIQEYYERPGKVLVLTPEGDHP